MDKDNQVKEQEICTCCGHDKSIHVMEYAADEAAFCTDPNCECPCFTSTKSNSHPSSQSLKRIETNPYSGVNDMEIHKRFKAFEQGADTQYAADQPVVAELEKQIETLKEKIKELENK